MFLPRQTSVDQGVEPPRSEGQDRDHDQGSGQRPLRDGDAAIRISPPRNRLLCRENREDAQT